jgi:hypothetical protein
MIKVIRSKARELQEPTIISAWTPTILDAYDSGEIQPELKYALPLFIHNIAEAEIKDYISSDLIGSNHLNDQLINFTDSFDKTQITAIIINAFSLLNTKGKSIDVSEGSRFSCIHNNQRKVYSTDIIQFKYSYSAESLDDAISADILGLVSHDVCQSLAKFLQNIIDKFNDIVFYTIDAIKTFNDSMKPTLIINFRFSLNSKLTEVSLDEVLEEINDSEDSDESDDFMNEFTRRNIINKDSSSSDVLYTVDELNNVKHNYLDETEYLLSSTENERRLNRSMKQLGHIVQDIQFQADNMGFVGYYCIGGQEGLQINVKSAPNWFQKKMLKLFFNIEWYDRA